MTVLVNAVRAAAAETIDVTRAGDVRLARVAWTLRLGAALCFIGHGAFGIIGKESWLPYFAVAGIGPAAAWRLMPVVGTIDVLMGLLLLRAVRPAILLYMTVWAAWTAALRPLSGESMFELLERAGNYGVPLALLVLAGMHGGVRGLFKARQPVSGEAVPRAATILRWSTVALLLGHAGFGLILRKPLLADHLAAVGLAPGWLAVFGAVDLVLALAVGMTRGPAPTLLAAVLSWKLGTELLYPLSGAPVWEFIERAGSYAAPLALLLLGGAASRTVHVRRGRTAALHASGIAAVALVLLCSGSISARAQNPPADLSAVLERLRGGGLVLACRHARTDRTQSDTRAGFDAPRSGQRNLSTAGIEQARRIGEAIRQLRIPVGDVFASPYLRTYESAELTFQRATRDRILTGEPAQADLLLRFADAPAQGTNRALVTHMYVLRRMLPAYSDDAIAEGDCVIVEPRGEAGYRGIALVRADDWTRMSGAHIEQGTRDAGAVTTDAGPAAIPEATGAASRIEAATRSDAPVARPASIVIGPERVVAEAATGRPLTEPHVAVHPTDVRFLAGAAIVADVRGAETSTCAAFASADSGSTWTRTDFALDFCADPWISLPGGDRAVLALLGRSAETGGRMEMLTYASGDRGRSWTGPFRFGGGFDHPTLAAGPARAGEAGSVYLVANKGVRNDRSQLRWHVFAARSDDGGRTFENTVSFAPSNLNSNTFQHDVLRDGTVVVPFFDFQRNVDDFRGEGMLERRRAWVTLLGDSGRVATEPLFAGESCGRGGFPALAADRSDGPFADRLYIVCGARDGGGIVVYRSADGGERWSGATLASDSTTFDGRTTMIAVNRSGIVGLAWYDTAEPGLACTHARFTASFDGGVSFLPPQYASAAPSCAGTEENGWAGDRWPAGGDYAGLAARADGAFQLFWSDARTGPYSLRTAVVDVRR